MQYIDPYALFDFDPASPDELDRSQVRRARQKILAEFELSDDIVIEFKGHSVDKSTALRLLEELEQPDKKWQHWYLHQNPFLQQFLSQQKVRFLRNIAPAEELGDEAFRAFLSKQLVPIFDQLLTENFKKGRKPEVSLLIQRLDLIHSRDHDLALKGTLRHINLNIQSLKDAMADPEGNLEFFDGPELYSNSLIDLLNRLPNLYQHIRNRYADALEEWAIALENNWSFTQKAFEVICAAAELETDLSTREHVNHLKVQLWKRQRKRKGQDATASQHYGYQQEQEGNKQGTQQHEFQWERSTDHQQSENFFNRKSPRNGATAAWVVIGLVILLVTFFVRGNWKGKTYTDKYRYEAPALPDYESLSRLYETGNEETQKKAIVFGKLSQSKDYAGPVLEKNYATGDQPFRSIFTDQYAATPSQDRVTIKNNSSVDLVLFVEDFVHHDIVAHRYVKAGDELELDPLNPGVKYFSVHSGRNWNGSLTTYMGELLGGFTSEAKGPPTSYLIGSQNKDYTTLYFRRNSTISGDEKHHTLVYDGKHLRNEKDQ